MYQIILEHLSKKQPLSKDQIQFFINSSIQEELVDQEKGQILKLLQEKGVTAEELSFFVEILSHKEEGTAQQIKLPKAVDLCGTGGSGLPRINTSTIAAFILAAFDIPIAKHGNKAASGRFGSFDLLEALGINIEASREQMAYAYWKEHLAFLFARTFHPAMKHFAKARQALGTPTIFNILGPLLSPVQAKYQIIGTAFADKMELLAQTAQHLGKEKVLVVRGADGLDEVTLGGATSIVEIDREKALKTYTIHPTDFGIEPIKDFSQIAGGDHNFNLQIAHDILQGQCTTRHADLVLINVATVLHMMKKVKSLKEGYEVAKEVVQSGKVWKKLLAYKEISNTHNKLYEIVGNKYQERVNQKLKSHNKGIHKFSTSFQEALSKPGLALIAEIKKASPSQGVINEAIDIVTVAKTYEASGVTAISVLTDEKYFHGNLADLKAVVKAVSIPVLRKDFIIDESQIHESAEAGAAAILLMASVLDRAQMETFLALATSLGLACLVEVHTAEELQTVLKTKAQIIGINNRDLRTLETDLTHTSQIIKTAHVGNADRRSLHGAHEMQGVSGRILISESGINTPEDIQSLPRIVDGVLVGSSIMANQAEPSFIKSLVQARKLFKACGIRTPESAQFCEQKGVDLIGLNFVPSSKRCIGIDQAQKIRTQCQRTKVVGVFQNQSLDQINQIAETLNLDYIQLAGEEDLDFIKQCQRPVIKTIKLKNEAAIEDAQKYQPHSAFLIFDGQEPGSGQLINYALLKQVDFPYILAGGITTDNVSEILDQIHPMGLDVASGIEANKIVSPQKIEDFLAHLKNENKH